MELSPDVTTPPPHAYDLSAADILGAPDRITEKLYVPEWKGNVYIRTISGSERDEFEKTLMKERMQINAESGQMEMVQEQDLSNVRSKLLVRVLCDKDGAPIFTVEHIAALGDKSAAALTRVYNRASAQNRVSDADVKELAGNSDGEATASS